MAGLTPIRGVGSVRPAFSHRDGIAVCDVGHGRRLDVANGTVVLAVSAAGALILACWCNLPLVARRIQVEEV